MSGALAELHQEAALLEQHRGFLEREAHPALKPFNEAAARRFQTLRFPHPKHEMYTFVNTYELTQTAFALRDGKPDPDFVRSAVYPACAGSVLVFADGVYRPDLSDTSALPGGVTLRPLEEACGDPAVQTHLEKTLAEENDVFACLNAAFMKTGLVVDLAPETVLTSPLQILYVGVASPAPVTHHPRLLVRLGGLAEIKLLIKFTGTGGGYFVNAVQDFLLEPGAGVTCSQFQNDPPGSWNMNKLRVFQKRDSRFHAVNGSGGCRLARTHYEVRLQEEGAELELKNAAVLVDEEQAHHFVRVHHEAPHCTSHQHFKNVVDGKGRASVDGTVIVNQGAQQTSSDQLLNNLMLSDQAHCDNKPNLMIFADDVKCTHGATVGQIDEDQLFYLKTRGLADRLARELLTTSFVESIIEQVPFEDMVRDLDTVLLRKLEARHG